MAKNFSNNNPLDELSGKALSPDTNAAPNDFDDLDFNGFTDVLDDLDLNEYAPKRKVGRPKTKTEKTKTINIAVPVSMLDKLNIAKICYGNNLTQYINKLIEKDMEANFNDYQHIVDNMNNYK